MKLQQTVNLNTNILQVNPATLTRVNNRKEVKRERTSPDSLKKNTQFCELLHQENL